MYAQRVKALNPYIPGEQPKDRTYIKLNANENPYPPSPKVQEVLKDFDTSLLSRYPDPDATKLREAFAAMVNVSPDMVYAGNGSDEILSFIFYTFFDNNLPVVLPEHTYSFYPVYASYYDIPLHRVPLEDDFSISVDKLLEVESCGIIFANPNAPTGRFMSLEKLRELLSKYDSNKPVVVDEAYIDFGAETAIPLLKEFHNLIIIRTFSKSYCFAGARLGFVIAAADIINTFITVKNSFNHFPVDAIVQKLGIATCEDYDYYKKINAQIAQTRDWFAKELELLGYDVIPSQTNFLFAKKDGLRGEEIYKEIKKAGILIRHFNHGGIENYVRITVGTREEMTLLLDAMKNL
ncbi:MAG: histidinol-phosphate transaminase [Spirochaetota bacterium]|nr:histidinol-phosphate transaminase [Spirochaetota bacterium]